MELEKVKYIVILSVLLFFMPLSSAKSDKVLVVGFDGADWDIIKPLMEKGEMPNLENL